MSTETNAERLKLLRASYHKAYIIEYLNGIEIVAANKNDALWLIEQAERAQELAAENFEIRKGYQEQSKRVQELEMKYENTGSMFGRQNQRLIIEENERLRKELAELKVVKWKNGRPTVIDWNNERWVYSPETTYRGGNRNEN